MSGWCKTILHALLDGSCEQETAEDFVGDDTTAVDTGYVSVTPLSLEMTQPAHFEAASFVAHTESEPS